MNNKNNDKNNKDNRIKNGPLPTIEPSGNFSRFITIPVYPDPDPMPPIKPSKPSEKKPKTK